MFAPSLPDLDSLDLEAAKALLIAQHQSYTATLSSRSTEIEHLMLLVEKLQRMLFGTSEKVLRQIEQLELQLEELQVANAIEERAAAASADRPVAAKPFRRPLPEHLPREIHTHMPDHEACPDCRLRVLEHVRPLLQGDPPCSSEDELRCLRPDRAGTAANETHRSWPRRPWTARPDISRVRSTLPIAFRLGQECFCSQSMAVETVAVRLSIRP